MRAFFSPAAKRQGEIGLLVTIPDLSDLLDLLDHAEEAFQIFAIDDSGKLDLFARNACGDTLIHVAVGQNMFEQVRYLVECGLDLNAKGDFMQTPLSLALSLDRKEMADFLIRLGATRGED